MKIGVAGPFNPYMVRKYFNCSDIPNINTSATSVNLYVLGLLELGHDVVIFTSYNFTGKTKILIGKNIKVYIVSRNLIFRPFRRLILPLKLISEIEKEIGNLDVLHAEWTYEYGFAVKKYKNILPIFCSVRDWCPYLLTLSKSFTYMYYWYVSYFLFLGVMHTKEFCFIANSDYTQQKILEQYPDRNVYTINNPLFSKKIIHEKKSCLHTYISISQDLTELRKNYDSLLMAFHIYHQKHPDANLMLIGRYSEKWAKKRRMNGLLNGVILVGNVSYDDIFSNLDKADVLVHPSLEETFGNIFLEAMCRRVLCIGGKESGAVPQVLGYGKYGLLCDVRNPNDIVRAMIESDDPDRRKKILDDSTEYIEKTYAERIIAEQHVKLFELYLKSH